MVHISWRGVIYTTLFYQVYQLLTTGRLFSPAIPVSSFKKPGHHSIGEILMTETEVSSFETQQKEITGLEVCCYCRGITFSSNVLYRIQKTVCVMYRQKFDNTITLKETTSLYVWQWTMRYDLQMSYDILFLFKL